MKKVKDLLLKNKVFVIVALILLIAIAVLVGVNVHKNNVVKKEQEAIKETVEKYIAAFNDLDADKMFETIDPKAGYAWSQLDGTTSEKEGKFKEQLDKTTDTEAESYKNNLKSEINVMKTVYSKYLENYKVELTNLEKHEKVDGVEGLIKVKAETKTSYTYDGKAKKPAVTVKDAKGKTLKEGTDYTVSYSSGRKNVGKYKVKVNLKGNYTGSKDFEFTIKPKGTSLSKLKAGKKQFKATWKAQKTHTTGYEVQYSTNKNFKSGNKKVNIKKNKTTSETIKKLKAKKKYYVRIRTYKTVSGKKIYSDWSKSKNVTTKK